MASQDPEGDGALSERFSKLLQPIRDLASNWNIDVASALEDYLEDLEDIQITLGEELRNAVNDPLGAAAEGDAGSVNFAQAALLIQGSALIYSKKVEYLYQLVHHTLDILSSQDKKQGSQTKAQSKQQSNNAVAEDEAAFHDATTNFLPLDCHIKEGKDIDIDQQFDYDPSLHGHGTRGALSSHNSKQPPSANPMMAALLKEDRGSAFRMNSCHVHASGALVIGSALTGGSITKALDALVAAPASSPHALSLKQPLAVLQVTGGNAGNDDDDDDSFTGHEDYDGVGGSGSFDGNNEVSDGNVGSGLNGGAAAAGNGQDDEGGAEPSSLFGSISPRKTRSTTQAASSSGGGSDGRASFHLDAPDPWAVLDPHDPTLVKRQPARKGKTYKVPVLVDPRSADAKRKTFVAAAMPLIGKAATKDKAAFTRAMVVAAQRATPAYGTTQHAHTFSSSTASAPAVGGAAPLARRPQDLSFPEFDYLVKRERLKSSMAKRAASQRHNLEASGAAATAGYHGDAYDDFSGGDGEGVDFGVYGEDGGGGGYDDDDDEENNEEGLGGVGANPNIAGQLSPFNQSGNPHNGFDNDYRGGGGDVFAQALDAAFVAAPRSYAELCSQHIASFMKGVDRYAHESQLSKRVGEWQDRLQPVLDEQNSRREFDIHEYGHEILSAVCEEKVTVRRRNKAALKAMAAVSGKSLLLNDAKAASAAAVPQEDENRISFAAATQAKPTFEAARLFLAMLQLTNNGNVALHHPPECTVCGPSDLRVEVLTTAMAQERFDNYLAPSLVAGGGGGK